MGISKHPADEMGKALSRAGGILSSLTACYDRDEGVFDLGHGFVFDALRNVERMLSEANMSLQLLCDHYDLRPIGMAEIENSNLADGGIVAGQDMPPQEAEGSSAGIVKNFSPQGALQGASPAAEGSPGAAMPVSKFSPSSDQILRLSDRLDAILEKFPREEPPVMPTETEDSSAKTYAEFLDRLTAMADSAATEAKRAGKQDIALAPVLESLRADVKRLRAVA